MARRTDIPPLATVDEFANRLEDVGIHGNGVVQVCRHVSVDVSEEHKDELLLTLKVANGNAKIGDWSVVVHDEGEEEGATTEGGGVPLAITLSSNNLIYGVRRNNR
jgi:hypothetical protein